ncbi:unnamed protein product [Rhizophagus irregularis]|nr:unnamed protein product [Rhizophagus irregularis]
MPPIRFKPKQRRSAISDDVKHQICEWSTANKSKRHEEIAKHFNEKYPNLNIERSTISKILSQSDRWKTINDEYSAQTFRHKEVKFSALEHAMSLWVENVTAGGVILTDLLIKKKAKIFAEAFNIQEENLSFSNGWLHKFKKRNNIHKYCIHRESESAPLASLPKERTRLQEILGRYSPDCIYNIDETGLFYRMSPSETLSTKPVSGRKKDKSRVTVLLGVNVTGTDKLKPWLIGNSKRPRPLLKVNLNRLPVHYRGNPKAWMNSSVFEEVLREIDGYFRVQDKKILLLVDNVPSHFNPHYTPDLEIEQNDDSDDESSNGKLDFY